MAMSPVIHTPHQEAQTYDPLSSLQIERDALSKVLKKQGLHLEALAAENVRLAATNYELSSSLQTLEKATSKQVSTDPALQEQRCLVLEAANARLRGYLSMKGARPFMVQVAQLEQRNKELELTVQEQHAKLQSWAKISEEVEKELIRVETHNKTIEQERDILKAENEEFAIKLTSLLETKEELESHKRTIENRLHEYLEIGSLHEWLTLQKELEIENERLRTYKLTVDTTLAQHLAEVERLTEKGQEDEQRVFEAEQTAENLRNELGRSERHRLELLSTAKIQETKDNDLVALLQRELDALKQEQRDLEDSSVEIIAQLQSERDDLEDRLGIQRPTTPTPPPPEAQTIERVEDQSDQDQSDQLPAAGDLDPQMSKTQAWTGKFSGDESESESDGPHFDINILPASPRPELCT